ncbi:secretion protein HlyD [Hyphomicrobium methylovorum]|uniref:HlyD family secretion protein n=1 Tax=Hyphomicrobium methylovorum TaxID=84 RepID=UPI0015E76D2A|nr:efflux RND transporter periplasmic adaptor subunit [Hyphomicrobium methylovorum]MBA2125848.1 secretion protein HlyD [Hyphomicrobium methylovorum]
MLKKIDPAISTVLLGTAIAVAIGFGFQLIENRGSLSDLAGSAHADTPAPVAQWAASATGRVEPKNGEVRIAGEVGGKIVEVLAKTNDQVKKGDLLLRLDDQDYYAKLHAAAAEESVRERERSEEQVTGLAQDRRNAEDAVAKAHREVFAAWEAFDAAYRAEKNANGTSEAVETARDNVTKKEDALKAAHDKLAAINAKPDMPLQQRLEASLALARADLTSAELALERTRIRAPADGTVLNTLARVGETAAPSPESAAVVFGDMSSLRLRAEVEERDAGKVHVGQRVVVKADAFPDQTFDGTVTSISQSLGAPRIATRGPRRPNDVEVVEVMVSLDGHPPLFTGMRVDTFFKLDSNQKSSDASAATSKTN